MISQSEPAPVISVLMSVHDGERFLPAALDSLLWQTLEEFELIVVDDGSTDATPTILASYAQRDPRIVILRNPTNRGISAALNRGLAVCRAPLVARADADDVYAPERLRLQFDYLARHPEIGLLGTAYHKIDAGGRRINTFYPPTENHQIQLALRIASCFCHPSVVYRADEVREVGGYNEQYWTAVDYELWSRLRGRIRMANLPIPLVEYRRHDRSITWTRGSAGTMMSRSIPRRELSAFLGRDIDETEVGAVLALNNGTHLEPELIPAGLGCLTDFLSRAREVEDPRAVTEFRQRVSRDALDRSRAMIGTHRSVSRLLFRTAIRWDPRRLLLPSTWKLAVRFLFPPRIGEPGRPRSAVLP